MKKLYRGQEVNVTKEELIKKCVCDCCGHEHNVIKTIYKLDDGTIIDITECAGFVE